MWYLILFYASYEAGTRIEIIKFDSEENAKSAKAQITGECNSSYLRIVCCKK